MTSKQKKNERGILILGDTRVRNRITHATTTVRVNITRLTKNSSKVSVRFGTFGNREASYDLMYQIKVDVTSVIPFSMPLYLQGLQFAINL